MAELHPKSHPPTSPMSSDSSVRSVERAIDVLFSFTQQEPVLDIPALQQRTGLSRPTLYGVRGATEQKGQLSVASIKAPPIGLIAE
jgi:IclR family KDG regulon transcriptional repressor